MKWKKGVKRLNRSLQVRRLYVAGQYANVEFTDRIDDIPEELANDTEYIRHLENLMILRLDAQEHKYFMLYDKTHGVMSRDQAVLMLEDLQTQERAKLDSYLESKKEPKDVI